MQSKRDKLKKIPNIIVRCFAIMIPRNKHLIVYGGAMDCFIDNVKYMFIYHNTHMPDFRHVWLTKNESTFSRIKSLGFEVVRSDSLKGILLQLRAGFFVSDDNIRHYACHDLSAGAMRINLWHGIPFKMIGWIKTDDDPPYQPKGWLWEKVFAEHIHGDYMLSTGERFVTMFSAALLFRKENIYVSGYPRTLPLIVSEEERERCIAKYETLEMQKLYSSIKQRSGRKIVYMPTFRDKNPYYINQAIPDWDDLNNALAVSGVTLYVKVHRMTPTPKDTYFSNIVIMDAASDIYPLLPLFDCLVTDISSIFVDYALLHKPIFLYTFDMDEYIRESRPVFKRFWDVYKKLKVVEDYASFKQLLLAPQWPQSQLEVGDFFDCPNDMEATSRLIMNHLK